MTDKEETVLDYLKPKTFRNRKTRGKPEANEREHPVHKPYRREHLNLLITADEDGWYDSDIADDVEEWYDDDEGWEEY